MRADRAQGLFVRDARVLSRWQLTVDGHLTQSLAVHHGDPYAADHICRRQPAAGLADSPLLVLRRRYVGNGMREDIVVRNMSSAEVGCTVSLHSATDLADRSR